jgi:hypothetical protein
MHATPEQARILRDAVAAIKAHPETFDMSEWVVARDCGTVCCLAGQLVCNASSQEEWAAIVAATTEHELLGEPIAQRAANALGLPFDDDWSDGELGRLFLVHEWPDIFRPEPACVSDCESGLCYCITNPTPEQLDARVEHWIETGE